MQNFDFNAFVAKAEKTKSDDLLKKIKGGTNDNCHDGDSKGWSVTVLWGLYTFGPGS